MRAVHRRCLQLFKNYGAMTDQEAVGAAIDSGWAITPSGLRSRRAELTPDVGRGIRDSGRKRKTTSGRLATVWEVDPECPEPEAGTLGKKP